MGKLFLGWETHLLFSPIIANYIRKVTNTMISIKKMAFARRQKPFNKNQKTTLYPFTQFLFIVRIKYQKIKPILHSTLPLLYRQQFL